MSNSNYPAGLPIPNWGKVSPQAGHARKNYQRITGNANIQLGKPKDYKFLEDYDNICRKVFLVICDYVEDKEHFVRADVLVSQPDFCELLVDIDRTDYRPFIQKHYDRPGHHALYSYADRFAKIVKRMEKLGIMELRKKDNVLFYKPRHEFKDATKKSIEGYVFLEALMNEE